MCSDYLLPFQIHIPDIRGWIRTNKRMDRSMYHFLHIFHETSLASLDRGHFLKTDICLDYLPPFSIAI